uniref:Protein turtle homolog B-like isoform X7 n=1 Tax=Hirondellea gigas TaxID=1518452 RepID=A0A6A7GCK5_9CRUS
MEWLGLASVLLLVFTLDSSSAGQRGDMTEKLKILDEATQEDNWGYVPLSGPYVDEPYSQNISVQVDKTAVLNCRILYIVGKTVSWIRSRDLHLLTVGRFTYTSDDRFKAVHRKGSDDWLLKIHYVQHRDAGRYECQVSTTPPLSHSVYLSVLDPKTTVLGGPDLYLDAGSTLNLTCVVKFSPEPPPYIFWYHEDTLLSYDSDWKGTSVATRHEEGGSVSRLLIQDASPMHSGNYTCMPATSPQFSVNVHVIQNEAPAAIHHKNRTNAGGSGGTVAGGDVLTAKGLAASDKTSILATPLELPVPSTPLGSPVPSSSNTIMSVGSASAPSGSMIISHNRVDTLNICHCIGRLAFILLLSIASTKVIMR